MVINNFVHENLIPLNADLSIGVFPNGYVIHSKERGFISAHYHNWTDVNLKIEGPESWKVFAQLGDCQPLMRPGDLIFDALLTARLRGIHINLFRNRSIITDKSAILLLGHRFECLTGYLPTKEEFFETSVLAKCARKFSHGQLAATQFILSVYNHFNGDPRRPKKNQWPCGTFSLVNCADVLNEHDRRVIAEWILSPWWA